MCVGVSVVCWVDVDAKVTEKYKSQEHNWDGREGREFDKQLSYLAINVRWFVTVFALQGPWIQLSSPSLCCG